MMHSEECIRVPLSIMHYSLFTIHYALLFPLPVIAKLDR